MSKKSGGNGGHIVNIASIAGTVHVYIYNTTFYIGTYAPCFYNLFVVMGNTQHLFCM